MTLAELIVKAWGNSMENSGMDMGDCEMTAREIDDTAQCDGGKCGIGGYCNDCPVLQAICESVGAPAGIVTARSIGWQSDIRRVISALEPEDWCGNERMIDVLSLALAQASAELTALRERIEELEAELYE